MVGYIIQGALLIYGCVGSGVHSSNQFSHFCTDTDKTNYYSTVLTTVHIVTAACQQSMTNNGNGSAPIQQAQCWFPGLAIPNAKILIYFPNKIYRSNFINKHSELLWFEINKMLIAV